MTLYRYSTDLTVCPPCGPGLTPGRGGIFQGILSLAHHTLPTRPEPE